MERQEIRNNIVKQTKKEIDIFTQEIHETGNLKTFHFVSANLHQILPNISMDEHLTIYKKMFLYKRLNNIDEFFKTIDLESYSTVFSNFNKSEILPAIFISYHIGAYRSAMALLIIQKIDIVLIMDPDSYKDEDVRNAAIRQYEMAKTIFKSDSKLKIFPADQADLTFQLIGYIKKQYSVLAFIDANLGYNKTISTKNSVTIDFCKQRMNVRYGLSLISFITKCPIVGLFSVYNNNFVPKWRILPVIDPKKFKDKETYCTHTMQTLYNYLADVIQDNYEQWEGWFHIHNFLELKKINSNYSSVGFDNSSNYILKKSVGFFSFDEEYYLMNKENYMIIRLNKEMFNKLRRSNLFTIEEELQKKLLQLNLLTTAD